jgi:hypothetical protein
MGGLLMTAGIPINVCTSAEGGGDALTRQGRTDVSRSMGVMETIVPFQQNL